VTGKLAAVQAKTGDQAYLYDAMGNRSLKWTPTQTQLYFLDGTGNELASLESSSSGVPVLKEANLYGSERLGSYRPGTETEGRHCLSFDPSSSFPLEWLPSFTSKLSNKGG
jgi:hypothetical protein